MESFASSHIIESPASVCGDASSVPFITILLNDNVVSTVEIVPVSVLTSPKVSVKSTLAVNTELLAI